MAVCYQQLVTCSDVACTHIVIADKVDLDLASTKHEASVEPVLGLLSLLLGLVSDERKTTLRDDARVGDDRRRQSLGLGELGLEGLRRDCRWEIEEDEARPGVRAK